MTSVYTHVDNIFLYFPTMSGKKIEYNKSEDVYTK
jgi:hypothetical protein